MTSIKALSLAAAIGLASGTAAFAEEIKPVQPAKPVVSSQGFLAAGMGTGLVVGMAVVVGIATADSEAPGT